MLLLVVGSLEMSPLSRVGFTIEASLTMDPLLYCLTLSAFVRRRGACVWKNADSIFLANGTL